ncbi:MAG: trigger factor [Bacteroidetes bacterium]|nr:trigger factor [Bacteroidota bacterium]MBU1578129.1 trigger factor [Bacteroidota bacterium]MBU2559203.1 trigger factor [Bacteroidota bacterium]
MNITQEPLSDLSAKIQIKLSKDDYEKEVNDALKTYQRQASMPGFRPGKVPFGLVKKMYGQSVMGEKINQIVSDALNKYIIDEKLPVIGYPLPMQEETDASALSQAEEFTLSFEVGFSPEINIDLSTIEVPFVEIKATEKDIQKTIDNIVDSNPVVTSVEHVTENARVEVQLIEVNEAGEEIDNGFKEEISFHMDQVKNQESIELLLNKEAGAEFIFNLAKALESEEAAEKLLKLDDNKKELASADFNMIIRDIQLEEKPALDEELFNKIFPGKEINDEAAFREQLKEDIENQFAQEHKRYFFGKAVDQLIEKVAMPLPEEFLKRWLVETSEGKLSEEEVNANFDSKYAKSIRWQMIEAELVKQNPELTVKEEEIRAQIKSYFFGSMGLDAQDEEMSKRMDGIVDTMLQNKQETQRINDQLVETKLTDFFLEKMPKQKESMSYEEFVAKVNEEHKEHSHE